MEVLGKGPIPESSFLGKGPVDKFPLKKGIKFQGKGF